MSPEEEYLRTTLRGNLLRTLAANQRAAGDGVRLFEAGRVYLPRPEDLPREREVVAGVLWGPRSPLSWQGERTPMDFYDAKGVVEALLGRLGLGAAFEPTEDPALHPGRAARVTVGGTALGVVGEVAPQVAARFDVEPPAVALFELELEPLLKVLPPAVARYQPLPRFPAATRDLALVVDAAVPAARVEGVIRRHRLVADATLFDVFTGKGLPPGARSLAYRLRFQAPDRTLTGEEVDGAVGEIVGWLEREVGARLRG